MKTVCINENVKLCQSAALNENNRIHAMDSDVALIESKLPGMNNEDKARAMKTIQYIRLGKRRYDDSMFSSNISGVPRKFH